MFGEQSINESESTFSKYQHEIDSIRTELGYRLEKLELELTGTKIEISAIRELQLWVTEFQNLRQSEFGWQDIHGMDEELIARAGVILERYGEKVSF